MTSLNDMRFFDDKNWENKTMTKKDKIKTFKVWVEFEREIEAKSQVEAEDKFAKILEKEPSDLIINSQELKEETNDN